MYLKKLKGVKPPSPSWIRLWIWGAWSIVWGLSPPKPPRGDGLVRLALNITPVFFNLFVAAEPSANACVAHGNLWYGL